MAKEGAGLQRATPPTMTHRCRGHPFVGTRPGIGTTSRPGLSLWPSGPVRDTDLRDQGGFMSGLEGPALAAGGGRLLGGLAAPAGQALARKLTFRRMVWRRVRKRVDFSFRGRIY